MCGKHSWELHNTEEVDFRALNYYPYESGADEFRFSRTLQTVLREKAAKNEPGFIDLQELIGDFDEAAALHQAGWTKCGFWFEVNAYQPKDIQAMQQLGIYSKQTQQDLDDNLGVRCVLEFSRPISAADTQKLRERLSDENAYKDTAKWETEAEKLVSLSVVIDEAPRPMIRVIRDYDAFNVTFEQPQDYDSSDRSDIDLSYVPAEQWDIMRSLYTKLWNFAANDSAR
jgi:hypothetical protein